MTLTPRLMGRLLAVSVLINLFAMGFLIAAAVTPPGGAGRVSLPGWGQLLPKEFIASLDKPRRQELLAGLPAYRAGERQGRAALKARLTGLADALTATPHDPKAVTRALEALRVEGEGMLQRGTDFIAGVITDLSAAERTQLADALRRRAGRTPQAPSGQAAERD